MQMFIFNGDVVVAKANRRALFYVRSHARWHRFRMKFERNSSTIFGRIGASTYFNQPLAGCCASQRSV
ncbi:unnamed protein product [Dicrocoelium dendriticum]|nr:unnamed protein product [Dicrocoelium dendriticum]